MQQQARLAFVHRQVAARRRIGHRGLDPVFDTL
jgi:hypothetical protein